jgi:hypothetical protein
MKKLLKSVVRFSNSLFGKLPNLKKQKELEIASETQKEKLAVSSLENEINTLCSQVDKNLADLEVSEELKQEALNLLEKVRTDLVNKNLEQLKVGVESLKLMLTKLQQSGQDNSNELMLEVYMTLLYSEVSEELVQETLNSLNKMQTELPTKNVEQLKVGVESLKLMLIKLQQLEQDNENSA